MCRERELANKFQDWQRACEANDGSGLRIIEESRAFCAVDSMAQEILDSPPQQPVKASELESREPAVGEVDWDAMGRIAHNSYHHPGNAGLWDHGSAKRREEWARCAKAVVAAYERSRPREKVAVLLKEPWRGQWHAFEAMEDAQALKKTLSEHLHETHVSIWAVDEWHYHPKAKTEGSDGD